MNHFTKRIESICSKNKPTTLFITYPTCLFYSQATLVRRLARCLSYNAAEKEKDTKSPLICQSQRRSPWQIEQASCIHRTRHRRSRRIHRSSRSVLLRAVRLSITGADRVTVSRKRSVTGPGPISEVSKASLVQRDRERGAYRIASRSSAQWPAHDQPVHSLKIRS